jgi:hypothetical protein
MTFANEEVALAARIAITANAIVFEIGFIRTPILIGLNKLLRESPPRDVRKVVIFHFVEA